MVKTLGIYVHIPFCEKKCDYCNFISYKCDDETKEKYVDYLLKEIELAKSKYQDYVVDTIFIGGGTPSVLRSKSIFNILSCIFYNFHVVGDAEITIEANPNSLTIEKLKEYKLSGINRLSIGLQTYDDNLLKLIGRLHNKKDYDLAIKNAKKIGFENINTDILLGLPTQKFKDVKRTLKHLVKLKIPHISAYGLIVEDGTKLHKNLSEQKYSLPTEEMSLKYYSYTLKYLKKHKLFRYEVSNFSKDGFKCKHNEKYWQMKEYLGLGLASHSFVDGFRFENPTKLDEYFKKIDNNELPNINIEKQTVEDLKTEFIMTGLRQSIGISLCEYKDYFNENLMIIKREQVEKLIKYNFIKVEDDRLFATNKGFEVLNQIILELI